jgi:hypothetical protein
MKIYVTLQSMLLFNVGYDGMGWFWRCCPGCWLPSDEAQVSAREGRGGEVMTQRAYLNGE